MTTSRLKSKVQNTYSGDPAARKAKMPRYKVVADIDALKHPYKFLKGRRSDIRLTDLRLEETADRPISKDS